MRQLRFVGLGDEGKSVVVMDENGEQFALAIDERFKAAARGDALKLGQLEIRTESTLRPAEIQARVRGGESVEAVARAAGVPVERVFPFARPMLLERSLVAEQAQTAHCRPWSSGQTPVLGELVETRLAQYGHDPAEAEWDAVRRDNGTWRVSVRYGSGPRSGEAVWVYDPIGRQVKANDDHAQALIAEPTGAPEAGGPLGRRPAARAPWESSRPLAVVGSTSRGRSEQRETERDPSPQHPAARAAADATLPVTVDDADTDPTDTADSTAEPAVDAAQNKAPETPETTAPEPERRPATRRAKTSRASGRQGSVPAWEDILLGVRDSRNA